MKKYQKQLLSLLAGAVLGYLLYYHFFMDVILLIAHEGFLYMIINIAMLLLSIVGCAAIIYLLLEKRVSRWMLVLLSVTYFIALFIILFCRHRVGRIAILDPLVGLSQLGDWEMLMQSLLNLLMFLPMGFSSGTGSHGRCCWGHWASRSSSRGCSTSPCGGCSTRWISFCTFWASVWERCCSGCCA